MSYVPDLHRLTGGRFEAICGKCLRTSESVHAMDASRAWGALLQVGWSLYTSEVMAGRSYAICPSCTAHPVSLDDAVKGRTRRRS